MKRRDVILLGLALALTGTGMAQTQSTVNYTAGLGERDVYFKNLPVPDGNRVSIGFFNQGFDVLANGGDRTALLGAWNELGSDWIRSIFGESGRFAAIAYNSDPAFDDQKIWMWLFATTDNTTPAADWHNVDGYGVYSSSQANWLIPSHDAPPMFSTASINTSEIDQWAFGSFDANHIYLSPVPEPSTWLLGSAGFGLLVLFLTRKRGQPPAEWPTESAE